MLTVALGLMGALAYGGADFYGGLASRRSSTILTTLGVALVGLIGLALTSPFVQAVSNPRAAEGMPADPEVLYSRAYAG